MMTMEDIREMLERLTHQNPQSFSFQFRNKAHREGIEIVHLSHIINHSNDVIYIPPLKDVSLYPVWLEEMIRYKFMGELGEYKEYETKLYESPNGYALYKSNDCVTFERPDGFLEFWFMEGSQIEYEVFKRSSIGFIEQNAESDWSPYMLYKADMYMNPRNKPIHHHGILKRNPQAYWGEKIYYDVRNTPNMVLLDMGGTWVWVATRSIEQQMPVEYAEEWSLCKIFA